MKVKQTTIKVPVTVSGVGLHTGQTVNMTFKPAPENHGYKFQRVDLKDKPVIEADVDYVVDISRGTTLGKNGVRVSTVEHTLAALAGLEIDNVLIELDGPETPIMDGSSNLFVEALLSAGIQEQEAERVYFELKTNVQHVDEKNKIELLAIPGDEYRVTVMVDYNSPVLGSQHASLTDITDFKKEIASSRTFCFLHELEVLLEKNLIKGGDLGNAIVVVDRVVKEEELDHLAKLFNKPKIAVKSEGILNNVSLRYQNEPARHKLLDVIGDLALVGVPIKGQIIATRPGHAANVEFAKKLKAQVKKDRQKSAVPHYDPNETPLYDVNRIMQYLPHRPPFLMIDKILELSDKHVVGMKNVSMNEWYFEGHFPGNPVMPGVLQVEAMAQVGGILVLNTVPDPENYWTYFLKIQEARFKSKVLPGDTVIFRLELASPIRRGLCHMHGEAFVGDKVVMEAEMMAQIVKRDKE